MGLTSLRRYHNKPSTAQPTEPPAVVDVPDNHFKTRKEFEQHPYQKAQKQSDALKK